MRAAGVRVVGGPTWPMAGAGAWGALQMAAGAPAVMGGDSGGAVGAAAVGAAMAAGAVARVVRAAAGGHPRDSRQAGCSRGR